MYTFRVLRKFSLWPDQASFCINVSSFAISQVPPTLKLLKLLREALKKNGESWESVPTSLTPPPSQLGNPSLLFFIGYLGLIGHEMDFEINIYFSLTEVV